MLGTIVAGLAVLAGCSDDDDDWFGDHRRGSDDLRHARHDGRRSDDVSPGVVRPDHRRCDHGDSDDRAADRAATDHRTAPSTDGAPGRPGGDLHRDRRR